VPLERAFVLHRRRYRETSLIVDLFGAGSGRVSAVAKGALRNKSPLRSGIQPLMPLTVETRGRGELQTVVRAEPAGPPFQLTGTALFSALYANELLMKLLAPNEPVPELFESYVQLLEMMVEDARIAPGLRKFEIDLLQAMGVNVPLTVTADSGEAVQSEQRYRFIVEYGVVAADSSAAGIPVLGGTLQALSSGTYPDADTASQAKRLTRHILDYYLDGRPIMARELFRGAKLSRRR
jgi:DNA repair protein RecO (recombination protein O)